MRGMVMETGSDPVTSLLLVAAGNRERVALGGSALPLIRRAVGLEIMVEGRLTAQRAPVTPAGAPIFNVERFVVRAADGIAAHDGIVTVDGESYGLKTADGKTHRVPHMPDALRAKRGARVFLAGPLDRAPSSYGIIAEAR
jgi:hypothetical protein